MADDPKVKESDAEEEQESPSSAALSPAPTVVSGKPKDEADKPADDGHGVQAEPLADGTVPTVLTPGQSHRKVAKGKTSITSIYRKADITTTIFTFVGAVVFAAIALGVYAFLNRNQAPKAPETKVTKLDAEELKKLESFFNGNSAGNSAQVLTVSSASLFKQRVAVGSDLKVVGGVQVDGTTALGALTVDKVTTLSITNVRGQLGVDGPTTLRGTTILAAGGSVTGNLAVTGNGSYGGSISAGSLNATNISVSGTLNLNGHLNVGGQKPSVATGSAAGSGASASVSGNDSAGTVTINTGSVPNNFNLGGSLVTVTFRQAFPTAPVVVISPNGRGSARLQPYVLKHSNWFIIGTSFDATSSTSYSFDYWVVQ